MKKNNRTQRAAMGMAQRKRSIRLSKQSSGSASSKSYVEAVSKIYYQEINDIGRFAKFAESYSLSRK
jgi:hypothetical protein